MCQFRTVSSANLLIDCNRTPTIKFIVPCLQKQWHLIIKGLHPSGKLSTTDGQLGSNLEGFAWREIVITGALPEVSLLLLPSDGWRVLPADLQVYPPIWRAGGRLANTLPVVDILHAGWQENYHQTSNIRHNESQNSSVAEKRSWFIRHLSDGLYVFYSNLWNLSSDIWDQPSEMSNMSDYFSEHWNSKCFLSRLQSSQ